MVAKPRPHRPDTTYSKIALTDLFAQGLSTGRGCPNGCARPYTPDIGLVGKARGKYTLYLGGNAQGTRLAFLYDDMVPHEDLPSRLSPLFAKFKTGRNIGESFGDFCHRVGKGGLT